MAEVKFPKQSVQDVTDSLKAYGFTNPYVIAGILATVAKETGFKPVEETSYRNTSPERIRKIFVTKLGGKSDAFINELKKNDANFFNYVYGGIIGNTQPNDGLTFIGRGYNGITGRGNYSRYGKIIGQDLITNPKLLLDSKIAADANAAYFRDLYQIGKDKGHMKKKIGINDPNEVRDLATGVRLAVQANAGWKYNLESSFGQEMLSKANSFADALYQFIKDNKTGINIGLLILGVGLAWFVHKFS